MSGGAGRGFLLQALRQAQEACSDNSSLRSTEDDTSSRGDASSHPTTDSGLNPTIGSTSVARGRSRGSLFLSLTGSDGRSTPSKFYASSSEPEPGLTEQAIVHTTLSRLQRLQLLTAGADAPVETPVQTFAIETVEPEVEEETVVVERRGTSGVQCTALSNYIRLKVEPEKGVYEYEVRFEPAVHASQVRFKLLNEHRDFIGKTKTFDGITLYLPIQLPEKVNKLQSKHPNDGSTIEVTLIYKRKKKMADCLQLYGLLFDRIMRTLKFIRFGKKNFDPSEPKVIPQHKLEIYPGQTVKQTLYYCCSFSKSRLICIYRLCDGRRRVFGWRHGLRRHHTSRSVPDNRFGQNEGGVPKYARKH